MTKDTAARQDSADAPFARVRVGEIEITSLLDGISTVSDQHFPSAGAERIAQLRDAAGFAPGLMPLPFNAFHFRIGGRQYLVDVGNNRSINPRTGGMFEVLPQAGIDPAEIDVVLITHVHVDHVTGLLSPDGRKIFPNAELVVARAELEYWGDAGKIGNSPAEVERVVVNVAPVLEAYRDHFRPFDGTPEVAPGVQAVPLHGHSPAQTGYLLASGGERLLFWADTVHLSAFQLPEPDWSIIYDVDPVAAVATRKRVLEMVVGERLRVGGAHLPAHGIGFIERDGGGYRFLPAV